MERDQTAQTATQKSDISTHTLTWSVTDKRILIDGGLCDFNSHAHVERDANRLTFVTMTPNFNSHAHVERDVIVRICWDYCRISTHTLTWSVTHSRFIVFITNRNFNSHAHVERDQ